MLDVTQIVRDKKSFTVTTELVTVDTVNEKPILLLKNPPGSAKDILITHFKFGTDASNVRSVIRVFKNPTVTADGTAITIANTYIESSPPTSSMETYKFPTVTDNGDILNIDINPNNSPSKGLNRWYWVAPGNSLLVTIENSVSNATSFSDIYWLEDI